MWGGGGRGKESEGERGKRERELVVYSKVWELFVLFCFFTNFVSSIGPCAPKEKWHRKEHIIIIIIIIIKTKQQIVLCSNVSFFKEQDVQAVWLDYRK